MELHTRVRALVADKGYKSLQKFAKDNGLSYYLLRKLANNETNSFDRDFLINLCNKLDCEVGELLVIKK
ncbi:helix-turn-helix transcriptional regulator [Bacillus sp. DTU_2020_1000418_1_SI_GHA_SEK_038]|uniref:helix-turn-helix domain-containing protein n=1 Tax=Bacillus sp. DTU_2020_1000418_1_SI_GHA_SEK_038 TaxID=3077585 RepID=UPI0028E53D8F|nr:helix-turn-helix transcriptional regulator [Bacillus sp. DTU_2020_1000418_1_SI_GHA_SEK_038]WNS74266.1 helix-turn-helix transcriptional regulator [Bacillus sp. DTU_2020_1000418_1_SI_GHA_SEK_038]